MTFSHGRTSLTPSAAAATPLHRRWRGAEDEAVPALDHIGGQIASEPINPREPVHGEGTDGKAPPPDGSEIRFSRAFQSVLLWGTWLVSQMMFFSVASMVQTYYLVMVAPSIAALVGIGVVAMWRDYRRTGWRGWVLPAAIVATTLFDLRILADSPAWTSWLIPVSAAGCAVAAGLLVLGRFRKIGDRRLIGASVLAAMVGLFVAPAVWSATPSLFGDAARPIAGPTVVAMDRGVDGRTFDPTPRSDSKLVDFLQLHQGTAQYLVATLNANVAAPIILDTGKPVMALGGFMGSDPILSVDQLRRMVTDGAVRYFLLQAPAFQQANLQQWVGAHCSVVPPQQWQSARTSGVTGPANRGPGGFGRGGVEQLYDCNNAVAQGQSGTPTTLARAGNLARTRLFAGVQKSRLETYLPGTGQDRATSAASESGFEASSEISSSLVRGETGPVPGRYRDQAPGRSAARSR